MSVSTLERETVAGHTVVLAPANGVLYRNLPIRAADEEQRRQFAAQGRPDQTFVTDSDPIVEVGDTVAAQTHVAFVVTEDSQYFVPMPINGVIVEIGEEGHRVVFRQPIMQVAPS